MKSKPVIFWDVDGVLNTPACYGKWVRGDWAEALDLVLVERAYRVVQALGASCVLSSTWRLSGYERTLLCLERRGWPTARQDFIDCTPHLGTIRGAEIGAWLYEHADVTAFAIVDDDADMGTHLARLVQTDGAIGLSEADCVRLQALFVDSPEGRPHVLAVKRSPSVSPSPLSVGDRGAGRRP